MDRDPNIFVIVCLQHEIEDWLRVASYFFSGTNTLFILDDCAASKDVKGRTGQLVNLGFSARHDGISVWVLTQQITSISKPYRDNIAAIVLFYTPSSKTTKAIFEDYAGELTHEEYKEFIAKLKKHKFSTWSSLFDIRTGLNTNAEIYIGKMDTPTRLHKLTVLSQLLDRLRTHTLDAQNAVIKAAGEEDLRLMLLNRYPLRLNSVPDTMAGVIREMEALLPDVKRIIEI